MENIKQAIVLLQVARDLIERSADGSEALMNIADDIGPMLLALEQPKLPKDVRNLIKIYATS